MLIFKSISAYFIILIPWLVLAKEQQRGSVEMEIQNLRLLTSQKSKRHTGETLNIIGDWQEMQARHKAWLRASLATVTPPPTPPTTPETKPNSRLVVRLCSVLYVSI